MKNSISYNIDNLETKIEETRRLEKRTAFRMEEFTRAIKDLRLKKGARILEIGSGTGYRSSVLAQHFTTASVLGVDISAHLVNLSTIKYRDVKNLQFANYDLNHFFKTNILKFDLIYMRLVLQHLSSPQKAINICYQLLRRGGTLIVEDVDRQMMVISPSIPSWEINYANAIQSQRECGGDPMVGRKIPSFLRLSGFKTIENLSYLHFGEREFVSEWITTFAPSFFRNLDLTKKKSALQCLKKLEKLNQRTPISFTQIWFMFKAVK